jgi:uncharacterized membrane protein YbhN (UPF0104 family)
MSDTDATDLAPIEPVPEGGDGTPKRKVRWRAVVGLAGIAGLAIASFTMVDDVREQALPGPGSLAGALALQFVAMVFAARGWAALFPPTADRIALMSGLYTSQLTKYLPAGGFVQAASQVALSSQDGGIGAAALRLPVFSLCSVVGAATLGSAMALDGDLPAWARVLVALGLLAPLLLDRRVLAAVLRLARRLVKRLPEPDALPPQGAILRCYGFGLVNVGAYGAAFVVLMSDMADIEPVTAAAAFCAGWAAGYLALPLPSGLVVREAVIIAALPNLAAGSLLAASVAHRVTGFVAEAVLAGSAHLRAALTRRRSREPRESAGTTIDRP